MPLFTRSPSTAANAASRRGELPVGSRMSDWRVGADDRAGPPPARRSALRAVMPLAFLLGSGGALYANPWIVAQSVDWLWQQVETVRARSPSPSPAQTDARVPPGETDTSAPTASPAQPASSPSELPLPPAAEQAARVAAASAAPTPSGVPASARPTGPAASASDTGFNAPYAPPKPLAAEPFQIRAEAVGLHPDMSKAVLARLSTADLQNARVAIEKLLVETSDDAVVVWPKQRRGPEAQFRVHFVAGSDGDCRRYVVAVAKDGWQTTGLPMERCAGPSTSRKIEPR